MKEIDADFNSHTVRVARYPRDYFTISLWQYQQDIEVSLDVYSGDDMEASFFLTPAEARELGASLCHFADQVEGSGN